jgi:hypothetical protein
MPRTNTVSANATLKHRSNGRKLSLPTNNSKQALLISSKMHLLSIFTFPLFLAKAIALNTEKYLTTTAVVTDSNHHAHLECWQFLAPFTTYPTVGSSLVLANTTNITYVILPPRSAEGIHKPPSPMFFVLLSGEAHVTFPYNDEELWIRSVGEGGESLIVAVDVRGEGHFTEYPGERESVALQVPFRDGIPPDHRVLGKGNCSDVLMGEKEMEVGLSEERQKVLESLG